MNLLRSFTTTSATAFENSAWWTRFLIVFTCEDKVIPCLDETSWNETEPDTAIPWSVQEVLPPEDLQTTPFLLGPGQTVLPGSLKHSRKYYFQLKLSEK